MLLYHPLSDKKIHGSHANMTTFRFAPTSEVPATTVQRRSTLAKVRIEPCETYVDAKVEMSGIDPGDWTASVDHLPVNRRIPRNEQTFVLCLYRGAVDRPIGTIRLGSI